MIADILRNLYLTKVSFSISYDIGFVCDAVTTILISIANT